MLEGAEGAGDRFARGSDEFTNFLVRHGETKAPAATFRGLPLIAPVEQKTCKLFGRCGSEPYGTQLVAGPGDAAAQFFNHGLVSLGVTSEKVEEVAASDVCDLGRVESFHGDVIRAARECGGHAEHFAFARNGEAEAAAFAGVERDSYFTFEDDINALRGILLGKNYDIRSVRRGELHRLKILQRGRGQLVEELADRPGLR